MIWYKNLYIGESLVNSKEKVIKRIQHNVLQPGVYIIVLATNGKDNFRIIHTLELLQKAYPKNDLMIIGIAKGKEEAFFLVSQIVQDVYKETNSVDNIVAYFSSRGGL